MGIAEEKNNIFLRALYVHADNIKLVIMVGKKVKQERISNYLLRQ